VERQFTKEIESLRLGDGETFHGEGILAVTKALLQSGVSYVGGYQGAPVSHLLDVMVQAREYLDELGVHVEACTSEASAAAMLGASINYPARGAVTWKSIVGTNVAADALSYLASAGVMGGTLIVLGEDYGEGGVVAQERSHAYALKSLIWLLDPRPNLPTIVEMVERGFELSEASNTPVMMEMRIRACHVRGSFPAKKNLAPAVSTRAKLEGPPKEFIYDRLAHPPATFRQEKLKNDVRLPAARRFILEKKLNEHFDGAEKELGIIVQGGLYNGLHRALRTLAGVALPARPTPGASLPQPELSEAERRHAAGLMRVNHTGEVCAQALYAAQALVARTPEVRARFATAARDEEDHLAWTATRLAELSDRTSLLNPLWYAGSFAIGVAAGVAGDRANLGFVVETERQVEEHLTAHIERLPPNDTKSRAIVTQMRDDEARHGAMALEAGAVSLPFPVRRLMRAAADVMRAVAYRI